MSNVDDIILQCVEVALADVPNKNDFFLILQRKYRLDLSHLSETFITFHLALKEVFGTGHYQIERDIIRILHERSKQGYYRFSDEVVAFSIILKVILADSNTNLDRIKKGL